LLCPFLQSKMNLFTTLKNSFKREKKKSFEEVEEGGSHRSVSTGMQEKCRPSKKGGGTRTGCASDQEDCQFFREGRNTPCD